MPDVIVDYDMSRHAYSIVHQEEVIGISVDQSCFPKFGPNNDKIDQACNLKKECASNSGSQTWQDFSHVYCCQREEVISYDGVRIPLTIVYSRESWQKGQSPGILQGYGAYGETLDKSWCADRLSLLDRGWVFAFADVRWVSGFFKFILSFLTLCHNFFLVLYRIHGRCVVFILHRFRSAVKLNVLHKGYCYMVLT